jgi:hypothetical protein
MSKDHGLNLHQKIHYRRTREIIVALAEKEGIDIERFDLLDMASYETIGETLKGKNVTYDTHDGSSCWVENNRYEIIEVPSKLNQKGSPYGEFIYFAYNVSFDYHLFGRMGISLNREMTTRTKLIQEIVHFEPHGKFDIVFGSNFEDNAIRKVEYGTKFTPGAHSSEHTYNFDSYNKRKSAYKLDRQTILSVTGVKLVNNNSVVDNGPVDIYKKKKNPPAIR